MDTLGWILLVAMAVMLVVASPFVCYVLAKVITSGVLMAQRQFRMRDGPPPDIPDEQSPPKKTQTPPMIVNPNREEKGNEPRQ